MLQLANGATVHAAFIVPESPGMKPHGVVLAETHKEWICWNIHWDGEVMKLDPSDDPNENIHERWEAENGHYFQKDSYLIGEAKALASQQFTRQLRHLMPPEMNSAIWRDHQHD